MRKKRNQNKSIFVRLLVICVSVYMITTLAGLWNTLNESKKTLADLQQQYAEKEMEIEELRTLLSEGSQSALIEKAARDRLGYVYSNEEIYIDISGN